MKDPGDAIILVCLSADDGRLEEMVISRSSTSEATFRHLSVSVSIVTFSVCVVDPSSARLGDGACVPLSECFVTMVPFSRKSSYEVLLSLWFARLMCEFPVQLSLVAGCR